VKALVALALLAPLATGCGTNKPELPSGVNAPASCVALDYPDGPYGTEAGAVVQNVCLRGWLAPERVSHDESSLESIRLSDFYDPDGQRGVKLLLVNTAAVWCSACRIEHEDLPARAATSTPRGLGIVAALFQDQKQNPASVEDLARWVETFGTNFPMSLDPDYAFGLYASAETAPLNLLIDPRSMTILKKYIGDQSAVMWPYIDAQLAAR
jgi:hypothetical protein